MAKPANTPAKSGRPKALRRNKTGRSTRTREKGSGRFAARKAPAQAKPDPKPAPAPAKPNPTPDKAPESDSFFLPRLQVAVEQIEATEARIIKVLANPALLGRSVQAKCEAAGVSRTTWYRILSDPLFITRARAVYRHALEVDRAQVMTALLTSACDPSRDGHQDRKLYFQLLGDLDEAAERRKGTNDSEAALKGMSDQELIETARELGLAVPAGVERRTNPQPKEGVA